MSYQDPVHELGTGDRADCQIGAVVDCLPVRQEGVPVVEDAGVACAEAAAAHRAETPPSPCFPEGPGSLHQHLDVGHLRVLHGGVPQALRLGSQVGSGSAPGGSGLWMASRILGSGIILPRGVPVLGLGLDSSLHARCPLLFDPGSLERDEGRHLLLPAG